MASINPMKLEEATYVAVNSNNSNCDTSVGGSSSDKEDDLDCQLKNNDNIEDLRYEIWKRCDTLFLMARYRYISLFCYFILLLKGEDKFDFALFIKYSAMK